VPGAPPVDRAGDISLSGTPKWSASLLLSYKQGGLELIAQERYVGPGRLDTTFAPAVFGPDDRIEQVFYTDLTIRQRVAMGSRSLDLFATVNNLFNRQPPLAPAIPLGTYRATNAAIYDTMGRYFSIGARVKF
jgi:outer membrane receptor protein involved in Fe transport